MTGDKNRTQ